MSQPPTQSFVRNCLLSALAADDFALVAPHLEAVDLDKDMVLCREDQPIDHAYFPDRGIGSMVASVPHIHQVEVGIFGRDGMAGTPLLLGTSTATQSTFMQVAGDGYRISSGALEEAIGASRSLHMTLLRYIQTLMTQASFTALSNATLTIEERLARWLVMTHDRVDGDELPLTHEFLSIMLGVRRPSVTSAIHVLEGTHLIRSRRGLFTVLDREALIAFAGGTYGQPEREYSRLIGASS